MAPVLVLLSLTFLDAVAARLMTCWGLHGLYGLCWVVVLLGGSFSVDIFIMRMLMMRM